MAQANADEIDSWFTGIGERHITLAYSEKSIVGSIAHNYYEGMCIIWGMYVLKHYQRAGVGSCLLENCIEKARCKNIFTAELFVLESSANAVKFYETNGFSKVEKTTYEIVQGFELASWKMRRRLCYNAP